ncbi:MAG: hypothetical protein IT373_19430 [Polyangiaceae bacterium]|nr:hypothetical protein [Polyangiaceae bacterium]
MRRRPGFASTAALGLATALLLPRPALGSDELAAAATAAGRPRECVPAGAAGGATIWQQARSPFLARYCGLVARAHARMVEDPSAALRAAEDASRLIPGGAAPFVAMARAELRLGEAKDAYEHFARALALDPRAVEQPLAMLDLARVRRMHGDNAGALAVYRTLVPRASLLPTREERARVLGEAALTAMALAGTAGAPSSAASLDEALAYLREAAHDPHHGHRYALALVLALALDRQGQPAQAESVLDELPRGPRVAASLKGLWLGDDGDAFALRALGAERSDRAAAANAWRSFLASPLGKGPWGRRATERLAALEGAPRVEPGPRRRPP